MKSTNPNPDPSKPPPTTDSPRARSVTPILLDSEPRSRSSSAVMKPASIAKRPSAELKSPLPTFTNWNVSSELREVPSFYPLEKSSRFIEDTPSNIASRISDACRLMSVQATFDDDLGTANLITDDHVEIHLTLWKASRTEESDSGEEKVQTIVEAQRRKGCAVVFHRYCRNLLDAAQGCFDPKEEEIRNSCHRVELQKKDNNEGENSLLAIEIAASLIRKDRMDARRLGMESLCLLTDPTKTPMETALLASQIVLFGSAQDDMSQEADYISDELGIREAVLSLVQFGRLGDYCDYESDGEEEDNATGVEAEFNDVLHNLALAVLANALEVLETHGGSMARSETSKPPANTFLEESKEISKRELLSSLLNVLGKAESKPHDACLSAQCLRSLFQASKEAKRRARDLNAKQIVMTALDVGRRTHVKLENETENIMRELERPDEEEEDEDEVEGDQDSERYDDSEDDN
mmetsp:Transcript_11864/g.22212  ORF Transcript_11864/g.22212 Transcript_11864/m.22212 type:complete len:466 (+) Transcript_11864:159-1556(+)